MKKLISIMAAAFVALSGLMMTGCTEDEVNAIMGPDYTWCETSYDTNKDGTADFFVAAIYCPESITGTKTAGPYLKNGTVLVAGITVVIYASVKVEAVGLNAGTYAVKEYPKDTSADGITGSKSGFAVIYRAKSDFRNESNQYECTTAMQLAPTPLTNSPGTYVELDREALNNLNWKSMLATYLLR